MLTFIDKNDERRILETYANSYDFQVSDEEIKEYFRIRENRSYGNPILELYCQLNKFHLEFKLKGDNKLVFLNQNAIQIMYDLAAILLECRQNETVNLQELSDGALEKDKMPEKR